VISALIIFSRVSSGGISTPVSSREFFFTMAEVGEGRTTVPVSFNLSSSLRKIVQVQG
jgi:hypothetical protein